MYVAHQQQRSQQLQEEVQYKRKMRGFLRGMENDNVRQC